MLPDLMDAQSLTIRAVVLALAVASCPRAGLAQTVPGSALPPGGDPAQASESTAKPQETAGLEPLADLAKGIRIDTTKLAGEDQKLGEREANRLLALIADDDALTSRSHLAFLRRVLEPVDIGRLISEVDSETLPGRPESVAMGRLIAAKRLVGAIALGGFDGGAPFDGVDAVLLPLLGKGPDDVREGVVRAVLVVIEWERTATAKAEPGTPGSKPGVLTSLGGLIEHNPPPEPALLSDVSRVLWESDGKRLLAHTVAGMMLNRETFPESFRDYRHELRLRLLIDFTTPEGWKEWWDQHSAKTMPQIFLQVQRKISADQAAAWRMTLQRLSEAGDPERLISELESAVQGEYLLEKRFVAVEALGGFGEWLRTTKFSGEAAEQEKMRTAFQARACSVLIDVARGEARSHEFAAVSRAALIELRRHQSFLDHGGENLRARLVQLIDGRFESLPAERPFSRGLPRWTSWKAELNDLVQAAGAFKVIEARDGVEGILADPELVENLELARSCVQALGRMVKTGLTLRSAHLLLQQFEGARSRTGDGALELRVDCANALDARPEDDTVRGMLRTFHAQLLEQREDVKLHIPAVGGLSTLAQEDDSAALAALVAVFETPERFDTQTLIAAVNAVAYVGGREALEQLLPVLRSYEFPQGKVLQGKEKDVRDQLFDRVTGIVRKDGLEGLEWTLDRLEGQGYARDDLSFLAFGLELLRSTELRGLLLVESEEVSVTNGRLRLAWSASLAQLRAFDLTAGAEHADALGSASSPSETDPEKTRGSDAANLAAGGYRKLASFVAKEPQLTVKEPALAAELAARIESRALRTSIVKRLKGAEAVELEAFLVDLARLAIGRVESDAGTGTAAREAVEARNVRARRSRWAQLRWIESLLASSLVASSERYSTLRDHWINYLSAEENASLWRDLPAGFRERYLSRLQARPGTETPEKE